MTLCIATFRFGQVSETFISDHVRSIAPGNTVLICCDDHGAEQFGCPVLAPIDLWQLPTSLRERIGNACHVRWRRYVSPGLFARDRGRASAFLKRHGAEVVLAEYGPMGSLLARTCDEVGIPLYVHFHGYDATSLLKDKWLVRHYKIMFRRAAGVIAPSRFLANRLAKMGCPEDKLHVSGCGVDPTQFSPTSREPQRMIAVGRMVEKKAPHLTIRAFAQICRNFPGARLDMIGDGPMVDECRDLIHDLGVGERIHLHGAQTHDAVADMMQTASIFVQHSVTGRDGNTEGLPVAILEAMASGLPIISTHHSGIPEAVDDGITGILVAEHDVGGMAAAMAELLDDPQRSARLGEAGRARVLARFTRDQARDRLRVIMGVS